MVDMRNVEDRIRRRGLQLMDLAVDEVAEETRANSPIDTGQLRYMTRSLLVRIEGDIVRNGIEADTFYAIFLRDGTRPHEIRPRAKKALRWFSGGTAMFARSVQHPGNRAYTDWWSTPVLTQRYHDALERATQAEAGR